jgi:hypothetical protein
MEINQDYINNFYAKEFNLYRRRDGSPVEKPNDKNKCLLGVMSVCTGCDFLNEKFIPDDFKRISGPNHYEHVQRCICSQLEEKGLRHFVIKHKESGCQFLIGIECFRKLFSPENHQEVLDFSKENCKNCNEIILRKCQSRINFCSKECKKKYGYESCIKCNAPKCTEHQQKFKFCYKCKVNL